MAATVGEQVEEGQQIWCAAECDYNLLVSWCVGIFGNGKRLKTTRCTSYALPNFLLDMELTGNRVGIGNSR